MTDDTRTQIAERTGIPAHVLRDTLLGRPPGQIDSVEDEHPDEVASAIAVGAAVADLRGPVSPESLALYGIARNYVAVNTEPKPKLFAPADPLAKRPRPRAQLSVTEVDAIFQRMRGADT